MVHGLGGLVLDYASFEGTATQKYLEVQRSIEALAQRFVTVPDVVTTKLDAVSTQITLGIQNDQVATSSTVTDGDGTRTVKMLFPAGVTASIEGVTQVPTSLTVRATEYTVGAEGPKAMPGQLPATTGYTYAVEVSADEAIAAGGKRVNFSAPVAIYVDNFVGFTPIGSIVPVGYYDRVLGAWVPSQNGGIVKVLNPGGVNCVDVNGDGACTTADTSLLLPNESGAAPSQRC